MKTLTKKTVPPFPAGSLTGNKISAIADRFRKLHFKEFFKSFFNFLEGCPAKTTAEKDCSDRHYEQNLFM